jgi:hypothetical protein
VLAADREDLSAIRSWLAERGETNEDALLHSARDLVIRVGNNIVHSVLVHQHSQAGQHEPVQVGCSMVERVLLQDPPQNISLTHKRRELAAELQIAIDTVRKYEDIALARIAEAIWAELEFAPPKIGITTGGDTGDTKGRLLAIVTGTSGTGVRATLTRFCKERKLTLVQLETYLVKAAESKYPEVADISTGREKLMATLGLPTPVFRQLWISAWHATEQEIKVILEGGKDAILTLHATYQHIDTASVISAIEPAAVVRSSVAPRLVIQLVDDCFDSLARLAMPDDGLFHDAYHRGYPIAPMLARIVKWREAEQVASQHLAKLCSRDTTTPFVLLPVKHPTDTLARMIEGSNNDLVYLSHPIAGGRDSRLGNEVSRIATFLQDSLQTLVLFQPTAIDELRFQRDAVKFETTGIIRVTSTELLPRWTPYEELKGLPLLWTPLDAESMRLADQPFLTSARHRKELADTIIPGELSLLAELIADQVKGRDITLLEQADHMLCYRPFGQETGGVAGGVQVECKHQVDAASIKGGPNPKSVPLIYHPQPDEHNRRIGALRSSLIQLAEAKPQLLVKFDVRATEKIEELLERLNVDAVSEKPPPSNTELTKSITQAFKEVWPDAEAPHFVAGSSWNAIMSRGDQVAHKSTAMAKVGGVLRERILGDTPETLFSTDWMVGASVIRDRQSSEELTECFLRYIQDIQREAFAVLLQ